MDHFVCRPEVGANIIQMFSISGAFALAITFSVMRWRREIKAALSKGGARGRSSFHR